MYPRVVVLALLAASLLAAPARAQSDFSVERYRQFIQENLNLTSGTLLSRHAPKVPYYKSQSPVLTGNYAWLDSITLKYRLTSGEKELLLRNGFVATERQQYFTIGQAFTGVYNNDLPVFITSDAILQALHASYDRILLDLEMYCMRQNLIQFADALSAAFPRLVERYGSDARMKTALADADLYVTIARSLLAGQQLAPQYASSETVAAVWNAIQSEKMTSMPLFSERDRNLDFSQFTVRGHYAYQDYSKYLGPYFKCMMWLGRTDFFLTPPPVANEAPWGRDEIRRMCLGAVLLNELTDLSGKRDLLAENDAITTFMVGESDNLTPDGLAAVVQSQKLASAAALLNDAVYDSFQTALLTAPGSGQRILSDFFVMDPFAEKPATLPVSFRLQGQRFILDSYIFSNVVYDRIVYNGRNIWRPMPNPLDALFVLGNDDALPLLREELDTYHYSSQLADLRYLTDAYDDEFWGKSLYNTWLSAIRALNPSSDVGGLPYFMQTAAWKQEKMNTQLASWAQLRHDNLLYAKQSYTGGIGCSFPLSYVEPYPELYRQIGLFAERAGTFFQRPSVAVTPPGQQISKFFQSMGTVMNKLEAIAVKERRSEALTDGEKEFLKQMLIQNHGECGAPPVVGWYRDLFYDWEKFDTVDYRNPDFVIADVHTQPTDEFGSVVGRVLHVGTGWVNLGVFLLESPFPGVGPTAFVGPLASYHEKVTGDFDRLTDAEWGEYLTTVDRHPPRPDWVNIYLADKDGNAFAAGRELPGVLPTGVAEENGSSPEQFRLLSVYPNPFNPATTVTCTVPSSGHITLTVYDILGRKVETLMSGHQAAGTYSVRWNAGSAASGVYFCRLKVGAREETVKMLLVR